MDTPRTVRAAVDEAASAVPIDAVRVAAFDIPLDERESDGTLSWDSTTIVVVQCRAGDETGTGYSYTHTAAALLVADLLAGVVLGVDAMHLGVAFHEMQRAVRNLGRPGLCATAVSAVDIALWDLKARLLGVCVADLLPTAHASIPVYGSGGFTSYSEETLRQRLREWVEAGFSMVKMKVGREPERDAKRVRIARSTIGDDVDLFVDANGAYSRKQALYFAEAFADSGVTWFEEPVSSDDLDGLRFVRDRSPAGMDVTAGEYGYDPFYFRRMLDAVDVLQADATRCMGVTGYVAAGALCLARPSDLSAHTAPSVHAHAGCGVVRTRHIEYFRDHVRLEHLFFDGALRPENGALRPDRSRPGYGLDVKWRDAQPFQTYDAHIP